MIECPAEHASLPALFDPLIPDNPALWAVFKGHHAGRAVVNDLRHPTQCLLRTDAVMTFASRRINRSFLDDAVAHFRQGGSVWLIGTTATFSRVHPPEAGQIVQRVEFYDCAPCSPMRA